MRTVYLGTSDFAATVLRRLADSPHAPTLFVTPPDSRQGRGRKLAPPPASSWLQALVLLRQKFERLYFVMRARQQGHRGKLATRASINRWRMVAIEFGM